MLGLQSLAPMAKTCSAWLWRASGMGIVVFALLVMPTWEAECLAVVIFGKEGFR